MGRTAVALACLGALGCAEVVSEPSDLGAEAGKADDLAESDSWGTIQSRCGAESGDEPKLYSSEFHWGYTLDEMAEDFDAIYASGKRLEQRAYFDEARGDMVLPNSETIGGDVVLPERLVRSVRAHIETALSLGYVDFVFFPDMGHSHLFIPLDRWGEVYEPIPVAAKDEFYGLLFDDPELRILYHTAEQLEMLDEDDKVLEDRDVQWRYYTRNPVGDNRADGRVDLIHDLEQKANTARDLPGHRYYGAGFNLSASSDGCFPYLHGGEVRYFDLSMHDLRPDPSQPVEDF